LYLTVVRNDLKVYAPQTKILEGWTNRSMSLFVALFKGVSTWFGRRIVEKCFEKTHRTFRSAFQNLRLGSIKLWTTIRGWNNWENREKAGLSKIGMSCRRLSPNEDFGRMNKRWNPSFRSTFQWFVSQIEHSRPWKVLRKDGFHLLFILPKSSFGRDKFHYPLHGRRPALARMPCLSCDFHRHIIMISPSCDFYRQIIMISPSCDFDRHIITISLFVMSTDTSSWYHHLVISTDTSSWYHHLVISTDTSSWYQPVKIVDWALAPCDRRPLTRLGATPFNPAWHKHAYLVISTDTSSWSHNPVISTDTSSWYHHRVISTDTWYHHIVNSTETSSWYHHLVISTDTSSWYHRRVISIDTWYHHLVISTDTSSWYSCRQLIPLFWQTCLFTIFPIISTTNLGSPFGKIVKRQVCQKGGWVADGCHDITICDFDRHIIMISSSCDFDRHIIMISTGENLRLGPGPRPTPFNTAWCDAL